ncbi:MAG TPA: CHASE domain-containing protein, partial [Ramlibacter sp.]|nr:CHASE domain-containing protein [Ramlibacter sp.]
MSGASAAPDRRRDALRAMALALLALFIGVSVTLLLWQRARDASREGAMQRLEYRTSRIEAELHHLLATDEIMLRSVAGLFSVGGGITRIQWRNYFNAIEPDTHAPGRQWVAYAQRVSEGEREAHEQQARADGVAGYAVRASERRAQYFPLANFRSFGTIDRRPIGLDLQEEPIARAAMARAVETGATELAGPLGAPAAAGQSLWALFVPVYAGGRTAATPADREAALTGYLVEAFDAMEMVGSALGPDATIVGMNVRDGATPVFTCP